MTSLIGGRFRFCIALKRFSIVIIVLTLSFVIFCSVLLTDKVKYITLSVPGNTASREILKTKHRTIYNVTVKAVPQILIWTGMFGLEPEDWKVYIDGDLNSCQSKCTAVTNKSLISISDAVIFHLRNLPEHPDQKRDFPQVRHREQAWVMYNVEAITNTNIDLKSLNGIFNLTMTYNINSDFHAFYRTVFPLDADETKAASEYIDRMDFLENKTAHALAMVSNCHDFTDRLQLITQLKKYMAVDTIGDCYGDTGTNVEPLTKYKFYMAFENSHCKEYVTEKFWNAISRDQVPVVAWAVSMDHIVPPHSYINIFDFDSPESAARYIRRVGENGTLYNRYFAWRRRFKLGYPQPFCGLCKLLHNSSRASQTYDRLEEWLQDDICSRKNWFDFLKVDLKYRLNRFFNWMR